MSFEKFMKDKKATRENTKFAVSQSFKDDEGKPLLWEIRPLTTRVNNDLVSDCTIEVPVKGKTNQMKTSLNQSKYMAKLVCASVVEPNLNDKSLQDSYGVMKPEDLILEMLDNPSEFGALVQFIKKFNGFDETLDEKVNEAKN